MGHVKVQRTQADCTPRMLQLCRATRNSAKLAAMTTGRHPWLPGVFKQTDERVNEGITNGSSQDWLALRKPTDRNQLRVPHRHQVGNMDHGAHWCRWVPGLRQ